MAYYSKKLPNGRWGIYHNSTLLASIGCNQTCTNIIHHLATPPEQRPLRVDTLREKGRKQVATKYRFRNKLKFASSSKQKNT